MNNKINFTNKALFIDFDGTICFDKFWVDSPDLVITWINQNVFGNKPLITDWMKGFKTSEQITQYVAHGTGYDYDKLWSEFVKSCEKMTVSLEVLSIIKKLSNSYKTILVTDNMDSFRRFTLPKLQLERYFDTIAVSTDSQMLKKDPIDGALFKKIAEENNVKISESIFIDNSPKNCELFDNLGWKGLLTDSLDKTLSLLEQIHMKIEEKIKRQERN